MANDENEDLSGQESAVENLDGPAASNEHQAMQTPTYPMAVLIAVATTATVFGALLGFAISSASLGQGYMRMHHEHHAKGHHGAGGHAGMSGPIGGYCSSMECVSKDDPETPLPDFQWSSPKPGFLEPPFGADPSDIPPLGNESAAKAFADQLEQDRPTVEEATRLAEEQGFSVRVVKVDGLDRAITMDYRFDRINLVVVDEKVVEATVG